MQVNTYRDSRGNTLAITLTYGATSGLHFVTPVENELQVAYMLHPRGHEVVPHEHLPQERRLQTTQEVILVKSGTVEVTLYSDEKHVFVLLPGDVVILVAGGHSLKMLTDCELYEVKQGPYVSHNDKKRL
jgi:hypothetical protein